jgi:hypothetical protein
VRDEIAGDSSCGMQESGMTRARPSSRLLSVALLSWAVFGQAACGHAGGSSDGTDASTDALPSLGTVDGRTLAELCQTLCEHAAQYGCDGDSLFPCGIRSSNCIDMFVTMPTCHDAWMKITACQADYPNPCDLTAAAQACHSSYCAMRKTCALPDPTCP